MKSLHRLIALPAVLAITVASPAMQTPEDALTKDARPILREASSLISQIDEGQQLTASANIAAQQVLAGDTAGAFLTAKIPAKSTNRGQAVDSIAWALSGRGQADLALDYIKESSDGGYKAVAYMSVAVQLAKRGDFRGAPNAARLILQDPSQRNTFLDALMRVYVSQWKAEDRAGATETLSEVLATMQNEDPKQTNASQRLGDYWGIIGWMIEAGNKDGARPFIESIREMAETEENAGLKQQILSRLAIAEADIGNFAAALDSARKLPPGQDRDVAFEVIAMKQARSDPEYALESAEQIAYQPWRVSSMQSVAVDLATSGNYPRALGVIDLMSSPADRAYSLALVALEQAQKGGHGASYVVELAWEAVSDAEEHLQPSVLGYIAVTRGILGDFSGATAIVNRLSPEAKVWPLWNLTELLVEAGRTEEAVGLAESQDAPAPRLYALLGTATALTHRVLEAKKPK